MASLSLDLPFMDRAHQQFTALVTLVGEAGDAELPAAWQRSGSRSGCPDLRARGRVDAGPPILLPRDHTLQHRVVLEVMREGIVQAREGQLLQVRQMAWQFRDWYLKHVQSMDAALALHLRGARSSRPAVGG